MSEGQEKYDPRIFYDGEYYPGTDRGNEKSIGVSRSAVRANRFYRNLMVPESGSKLLDIGCGEGTYLSLIKDTGCECYGIDISENVISVARERVGEDVNLICGDADPLPFQDKMFDYVTAWGVVEHFPSIGAILREMWRVSADTATIVIMVPNMYYYKFVWDTLRKGSGPVRHQKIEKLYAFREWKDRIESSGFSIKKVHRHNKFSKSGISMLLRKVLIPFHFSNHFVFVCEKDIQVEF